MDYFQGVVVEYLRAKRSLFVNTECCIQLNEKDNPDKSGLHWYCDAVAVDFDDPSSDGQARATVYLCEVSYSKSLQALLKRLGAWGTHWDALCVSLVRDCHISPAWQVKPWLFVPGELRQKAAAGTNAIRIASPGGMPEPTITALEDVLPWKYRSWNRTAGTALQEA